MLFEQVVTSSRHCRAYKLQSSESPTCSSEASSPQTRERIRTVSELDQSNNTVSIWIYPPSAVRSGSIMPFASKIPSKDTTTTTGRITIAGRPVPNLEVSSERFKCLARSGEHI
jgi:hypothetical protein